MIKITPTEHVQSLLTDKVDKHGELVTVTYGRLQRKGQTDYGTYIIPPKIEQKEIELRDKKKKLKEKQNSSEINHGEIKELEEEIKKIELELKDFEQKAKEENWF